MTENLNLAPDNTAVRVALWRAMHVQVDPPPHIIEDEIGLQLAAPDEAWRHRRDMNPEATKGARAVVVARARFIEDLVIEQMDRRGVGQYVILGAGLDTFAQRRPRGTSLLRIFEVDKPDAQVWKRQRLTEIGFDIPPTLTFVSVDFESGISWWESLVRAGFDFRQPAVIASAGVSQYLTREAITAMLRQIATFAPRSTLIMTFQLPLELVEPDDRPLRETTERGTRAAGAPFISFFSPAEMVALALESGFSEAYAVSAADLAQRYFSRRTDGLRPSSSEELLVATA